MSGDGWAVAGAVILMIAILGLAYFDPFTKPNPPKVDTAIPGPDMAQLDEEDEQV